MHQLGAQLGVDIFPRRRSSTPCLWCCSAQRLPRCLARRPMCRGVGPHRSLVEGPLRPAANRSPSPHPSRRLQARALAPVISSSSRSRCTPAALPQRACHAVRHHRVVPRAQVRRGKGFCGHECRICSRSGREGRAQLRGVNGSRREGRAQER